MLLGVELLPKGKRKDGLSIAPSKLITGLFGSRILPFDLKAATAYAGLVSQAKTRGYTIAAADGQIAAIASTHGFAVATRDVKPFVAAGVPIINPWKS